MIRTASERSLGIARDPENRQKDDFYATPKEGIAALLRVEQFDGAIWEPACGNGAISKVLIENGYTVVSTDLVDRGYDAAETRTDFLLCFNAKAPNIITNPPFKLNYEFMRRAVYLATGKVALLMRLGCLEGIERGKFYEKSPLARVWVFKARLQIWRDATATSDAGGMIGFAWFVWDHGYVGKPTIGWI
jgi:hypothetical protein